MFLALLALQATWDLPLLTPQLFPVPTGRNGAEEYAQAMDVLRKGQFVAYGEWQKPETRLPGGSKATRQTWDKNPPDPNYVSLLDRLDTLDLLAFRVEETSKFRHALDLVQQGNAKDIVFPGVDATPRFPPVADTIFLGRLGADSAYVELSNGHSDVAVQDLGTMMVLTERTAGANYMNTLVGTANRGNLLQTFAGNMDRFSMADAAQLEDLANTLLKLPPAFIAAFKRDLQNELDKIPERMKGLLAGTPDPKDKLSSQVQQLMKDVQGSADQMAQRIRAEVQANGEVALKRFDGPEVNWLPDEDATNRDLSTTPPKTMEEVEALLIQAWSPPLARNANAILRDMQSRTQIRMMRLAARIIAFRWNWERLPKSLDEMKLPAEYVFDPLSKQSFVYELSGEGFQVYSKGWKNHGRVDFWAMPGTGRQQEVHP